MSVSFVIHVQHMAFARMTTGFQGTRLPLCLLDVARSRPCRHTSLQLQRVRDANRSETSVATNTDNAASTRQNGKLPSGIPESGPHVDCVGTGMDVQCYVSDNEEVDIKQKDQNVLGPLGLTDGDIHLGQHVDVVETGIGASSYIVDDSQTGTQQEQKLDLNRAPLTAAAAAASGNPIEQLLGVALLVSPFFFWGTSMVAMKPVTAHTTPLMLGAMRLLPAGLVLVGWAAATGRPQPKTAMAWAWILAFALVDGAAFQGFLAEGLQRTSAGLGSVIIDSQPLSVALLAALLFGEALSGLGIAGLFIGVAGLLLLEVPQDVLQQGLGPLADSVLQSSADSSSSSGNWGLLDNGEFWMLLAAQSMAVGTVMVRWVTKHCDPVAATAWHMLLGGAMLAVAAVVADGDSGELVARLGQFNSSDALAMAYVSLLGGAASYGIFFYEATHGSLTAISSLTFLTPMFAAGAGYLVLGETLSPLQLLGAAITLGAVFMINTPASHQQASEKEA